MASPGMYPGRRRSCDRVKAEKVGHCLGLTERRDRLQSRNKEFARRQRMSVALCRAFARAGAANPMRTRLRFRQRGLKVAINRSVRNEVMNVNKHDKRFSMNNKYSHLSQIYRTAS